MTWGGDLEGIIMGYKPMLFLHLLPPPQSPTPPRSTSWTQLPLRTVGHWCAVVGWRGSTRERGRRRIDKAETGRERREEGGDGPAPLGLGYSLLLGAVNGVDSQNGLELKNAQKGTEERLVAVTELREDLHGRNSVCRKPGLTGREKRIHGDFVQLRRAKRLDYLIWDGP